MKRSRKQRKKPFHRMLRAVCCLLTPVILASAAGCGRKETVQKLADYGSYGSGIALDIARQFPFRAPYSQAESRTADLIERAFSELGYQPERVNFSAGDQSPYAGGTSANIIVRIPGSGFYLDPETEPDRADKGISDLFKEQTEKGDTVKRQVIIGARYDTALGESDREANPDFQGLSDSASSVGALLTLARAIQGHTFGYDVVLVAFGASHDGFRGAVEYASAMTAEQSGATDAVYIIGPIYAGDKLYAHAGRNALEDGHKYERRRKLYETTDVVLEADLPTLNHVDLLFNEGVEFVEYPPETGYQVVYREFTLRDADYVPFDSMNIPIVYIEAYNYDFKKPEACRESARSGYEATEGQISGTMFDNIDALSNAIGLDLLEQRINNTAFILKGSIEKGIYNGRPVVQGADGAAAGQPAAASGTADGGETAAETAASDDAPSETSDAAAP